MSKVKVILFILAAVALIWGGTWYNRRLDEQFRKEAIAEREQANQETERILAGLVKEDLFLGDGEEVKVGDNVTVDYEGILEDGTKFDSSYDRGQPFTFTLGAGQVIPGWDIGLQGMKIGGRRKLVVPPELGYGAAGHAPIPPNAKLQFVVELLSIIRPEPVSP